MEFFGCFLHSGLGVVRVVNRKTGTVAEQTMVAADQLQTESVKSGDGERFCLVADQFADAVFHLGGGFVGKSQRQNVFGIDAEALNHVCHFVGNHTCFAAAGTGDNELRTFGYGSRFVLSVVEFFFNIDHIRERLRRGNRCRFRRNHGIGSQKFQPCQSECDNRGHDESGNHNTADNGQHRFGFVQTENP